MELKSTEQSRVKQQKHPKKIERPRGTRDFLPDEMEKRRKVESIMRDFAERYGYREVLTPTFEHLELFTIKSGEGIVDEIYAFKDKGGRELALRPELTAPVMRLFVNECPVMPKPLRFYYFANCFRYERPQKGRYREFWQFGVELIGSDKPEADAEIIILAYNIMKNLNINFKLHIGHVGILRDMLKNVSGDVSSKIFRLIDKEQIDELEKLMKKYGYEELYEDVKKLISLKGGVDVLKEVPECVNKEYVNYLKNVCKFLDVAEVKYTVDMSIVRGLDYYTGVVFEAYAENLGAQKQICGGGSYRLAHLFGGEDVPSTGFALGFDRIMEVCKIEVERKKKVVVVNAGNSEKVKFEAIRIAQKLRDAGCTTLIDVMDRSVKKQMGQAKDADYAVIVGLQEVEGKYYTLKDLISGEQLKLKLDELLELLKE